MEQETKFSIKDSATADAIWNEVLEGKYGEAKGAETLQMKAVYYDTPKRTLKKNNIALRIRHEGAVCFATIKWGGSEVTGGLHEHEEINIPVDEETCFIAPPVEIFEESLDGRKMSDLLKGEFLEEVFTTDVQRRRAKLSFEKSIVEVAIDQGKVITGNGDADISEIEIELYSGELESVLNLTEIIAKKHGLTEENRSKYSRAMELLEKN